jgi:hypothetical protein
MDEPESNSYKINYGGPAIWVQIRIIETLVPRKIAAYR